MVDIAVSTKRGHRQKQKWWRWGKKAADGPFRHISDIVSRRWTPTCWNGQRHDIVSKCPWPLRNGQRNAGVSTLCMPVLCELSSDCLCFSMCLGMICWSCVWRDRKANWSRLSMLIRQYSPPRLLQYIRYKKSARMLLKTALPQPVIAWVKSLR